MIRLPHAGQRLSTFLAERFAYRSLAQWEGLIACERLLINDRPGAVDSRLACGDVVEFLVPETDEPPVDVNYTVLFEDDALLAVDKPGNLPIHPAGGFFRNTLWALLKRDRPELNIHFINRLDRETSGIVLIAKNPEVCARCATSLAADDAEKLYCAIVEGSFPESLVGAGTLRRHPTSPIRKKFLFQTCDGEGGKTSFGHGRQAWASTTFRRIRSGASLSLIEARLKTGRTHQIRATLEALGFPLVGDKLYGVDETIFLRFVEGRITERDWRRLRLRRQALHAERLLFRHPCTGAPLKLVAPLPEEMAGVRL